MNCVGVRDWSLLECAGHRGLAAGAFPSRCRGLRVQGFRVRGIAGSGFRVLGLRVQGFRVGALGFRVEGLVR